MALAFGRAYSNGCYEDSPPPGKPGSAQKTISLTSITLLNPFPISPFEPQASGMGPPEPLGTDSLSSRAELFLHNQQQGAMGSAPGSMDRAYTSPRAFRGAPQNLSTQQRKGRPPACSAGIHQVILDCRSLCEAVRAGCAPLMEAYGFPWPEMLHCHKFPLDNDLCIAVQFGHLPATAPPVTKACAQCETEHSADGLMEQMCSSDFVVKMRIKEIKIENGDRKLIGAQKKKKLLKPGPLKRKDTKRLVLHMKNGAGCPCPQLDSLAGSFLVMGRRVDGQLLLMAVYRWDKKNKEMKFAVKFMFSYPCSLYYPFFYGAAEPH
ncbi:secreted frizzled-related protein 5 [Tupaia chinensis]|uniref:secreted frizzled-related protein 5 n=1 Tax=Tupaia chinensis TaxID=246437 RepID=UPI0003C8F546|nr:secreted frizzled-related protein 5 [Tupaia chinensis]